MARLLARRQPHNAPSLHTAWTIQQIVAEDYRILEVLNYELATQTPAAWIEVFQRRLPCGVSSNFSIRNARSSLVPPGGLLMVRKVLLKHAFGTSPEPRTPGPVTWELRLGLSPVRSGSVSN